MLPGNTTVRMVRDIAAAHEGLSADPGCVEVRSSAGSGTGAFMGEVVRYGQIKDLAVGGRLKLHLDGPRRCPACGAANLLGYGRDASFLVAGNGGFARLDDYGASVVYRITDVAQCGACWKRKLANQPDLI